ncbi:hypothetical protein T12_4529 [Trichinella patagoniensis]|uniref:Uncharacterized protein n=1 Tax=Trichinella patagoniensis TaxID=990121 RepID=A0A0V0ZUD3_9BILA|nr:hypothetical protein T12_4529 [Trichinella patagoniensis]
MIVRRRRFGFDRRVRVSGHTVRLAASDPATPFPLTTIDPPPYIPRIIYLPSSLLTHSVMPIFFYDLQGSISSRNGYTSTCVRYIMRWTAVTDGTVLKQRRTRQYLRTIQACPGICAEGNRKCLLRHTASQRREMDSTEKPEHFFYVTGIPSSRQAVSVSLFMNDAVRWELSLPETYRENKPGWS